MQEQEILEAIRLALQEAGRVIEAAVRIGLDCSDEQAEIDTLTETTYTTSYREVRAAKAAGRSVTLSGRGGWYVAEVA